MMKETENLIETLALEPIEVNLFRGVSPNEGFPRIFGGLVIAQALLITPIAPHMLTNRPIVIPGSSEVRVAPAMDDHDEVFVTFDGQSGHPLMRRDVVSIRAAERPMHLVRASTRTYFDVLRQKLKWSER